MELDLLDSIPETRELPAGYELVEYSEDLVREHAQAKFLSFQSELDANVFPCLGKRDGCLKLMREIVSRATFVPEATWLARYRSPAGGRLQSIGTIQGMQAEGWGAVQNIGIAPEHRGRGLGSILIAAAAGGFREIGLNRMHLEVTSDNSAAVRLYERLGFKRARVLYKAADLAGV